MLLLKHEIKAETHWINIILNAVRISMGSTFTKRYSKVLPARFRQLHGLSQISTTDVNQVSTRKTLVAAHSEINNPELALQCDST